MKFYNNVKNIGYYYETYIKLLTHLMYMNDSDTVAIVSPNKTEILNREQFADYIVKFKNAHFIKYESEKWRRYVVYKVKISYKKLVLSKKEALHRWPMNSGI